MGINLDIGYLKHVAKEAVESLPQILKSKLYNLEIVVEDYPSQVSIEKLKLKNKSSLLGLYKGVPWGKRGRRYTNVMPDRIVLYKKPIEQHCKNKKEVEEKLKDVVFHEIGHYFGFNDRELKNM